MANLSDGGDHTVVTLDAGLEGARLAQADARLGGPGAGVLHRPGCSRCSWPRRTWWAWWPRACASSSPAGRSASVWSSPDHAPHRLYSEGTSSPRSATASPSERSAVAKPRLPRRSWRAGRCGSTSATTDFGGTAPASGAAGRRGPALRVSQPRGPGGAFHDAEADDACSSPGRRALVSLRNAKLLSGARYLRGFLEKLVDDANALIVVINHQVAITVFNRACRALSGFSREEILARFRRALAPEDRPRLTRVVAASLKGRSVDNVEVTILAKDGRRSGRRSTPPPSTAPTGRWRASWPPATTSPASGSSSGR